MNHITRVKFHILFTTFPTATPVQHRGEASHVSAIFQKSSAPSQTSLKRSIELKDIRDAFAKVKTAKSFGIDNISSYFMKLALPYIDTSLAFLFNTSIETSQFPDSWKVARITVIFKDGDRGAVIKN